MSQERAAIATFLFLTLVLAVVGQLTIPINPDATAATVNDKKADPISKFEPGFYEKIQSMIDAGEDREYSVIMMVKKASTDDEDPKTVEKKNKEVAKKNKDLLADRLDKDHKAKRIEKTQILSFVTANVPLKEIIKIADHDFVGVIGDGEKIVGYEMDVARIADNAVDVMLTGSGIKVGMIDSGIRNPVDNSEEHPDLPIGTKVTLAECTEVGCTNGNYDDSTGHGTHVAGIIAGLGTLDNDMRGIAPDATIIHAHLAGNLSRSFPHALDFILNEGGRIVNVSQGYPSTEPCEGPSNIHDLAADEAVDEGLLVVKSAGNIGHLFGNSSITSPGCGYNMITVGATNDFNDPDIANHELWEKSSLGPTPDGRMKPELVAPGVLINSTDWCPDTPYDHLMTDPDYGDLCIHWAPVEGTSFAAPQVTGAAALLLEHNPDYTPLEVKSLLLLGARWNPEDTTGIPTTASEYEGSNDPTLNGYGFGSLDVGSSISLAEEGNHIMQGDITHDQSREYTFYANADEQVKVILSWLKHPAGSIIEPDDTIYDVSDLDFVVTQDGNVIEESDSELQNNEFAVFTAETAGTYTITVTAEYLPFATYPETFVLASTKPITPIIYFDSIGPNSLYVNGQRVDFDFEENSSHLILQPPLEQVNDVQLVGTDSDYVMTIEAAEDAVGWQYDDVSGWTQFDIDESGQYLLFEGHLGMDELREWQVALYPSGVAPNEVPDDPPPPDETVPPTNCGDISGSPDNDLNTWVHNDNGETEIKIVRQSTGQIVAQENSEAYDCYKAYTGENYTVWAKSDVGASSEPADVELGTVDDWSADGSVYPDNGDSRFDIRVWDSQGTLYGEAQQLYLPTIHVNEGEYDLVATFEFLDVSDGLYGEEGVMTLFDVTRITGDVSSRAEGDAIVNIVQGQTLITSISIPNVDNMFDTNPTAIDFPMDRKYGIDGAFDIEVEYIGSGRFSVITVEFIETDSSSAFSKISGTNFRDDDGDGVRDAGEIGMPGWNMTLKDAGTGATLATTMTASDGTYTFTNLGMGDYIVEETLKVGYAQTYPASGSHDVSITFLGQYATADFGNEPVPIFDTWATSTTSYLIIWGDEYNKVGQYISDPESRNVYLDEATFSIKPGHSKSIVGSVKAQLVSPTGDILAWSTNSYNVQSGWNTFTFTFAPGTVTPDSDFAILLRWSSQSDSARLWVATGSNVYSGGYAVEYVDAFTPYATKDSVGSVVYYAP